MANRTLATRALILPILAASTLLTGCVAAIVPVATGALAGRRALQHHPKQEQPQVAGKSVPARQPPAAPATNGSPPLAVQAAPLVTTPAVPRNEAVSMPAATPRPAPPPITPPPPSPPSTVTSTWYDVVRYAGHEAATAPGHARKTVMPLARDGSYGDCGTLPLAAVVAADAVGVADALNVGALSTIGLEVVFTSGPGGLPPAKLKALAKQNVPTPVAGTTLFASPPGSEGAARQAIGRQYCVVALVGTRAADFPYAGLPGTPRSRIGWFLVRPTPARR